MSARSDGAPGTPGGPTSPQQSAKSPNSRAPFAEMALAVHAEGNIEETLDRVLDFALSAVQCGYAGVTLLERKKIRSVASTDPLVEEIDKLQRELGQGPDLDLVADRVGVMVTDMRHETRWPRWAKAVADTGIRSMLGIRLYTPNRTVGTLNFFDAEPHHFDLDDEAVAHVMARHAAAALVRAHHTENLWHAIDARKRIGQAQGILMERYGLNEDQAFQVLVRYSQSNNMKLRAVAEKLISTRALPGGTPPEPDSSG